MWRQNVVDGFSSQRLEIRPKIKWGKNLYFKINKKETKMDTRLILDEIKGKLPRGKLGKATLAELQNRLDSLNDSQRSEAFLRIQDAKLKTPIIVDICNFVFGEFGVGRFMIGDKALGFARLALLIIGSIVAAMVDKDSGGTILLIAMWIWWLVDCFLVPKKVRMQNLRKVLLAIDSVKNTK